MRIIDEFPHIKDVGDAEIGIEIEMEGPGVKGGLGQAVLPHWKGLEDGSLRGVENREYVLKFPVKRNEVPLVLDELKNFLLANRARIEDSDRCGVHIHMNMQKEEVSKVITFILLYLVFEDVLVRYCGDTREGNLFCLRARDAESMMLDLAKCKQYNKLEMLQADFYRYSALNVSSLCKYGSLEFRALRTPTDIAKIYPWVEILLAFKDFAATIGDSREIVENLSKNGELNYFKAIVTSPKLQRALMKGEEPIEHLIRQGVRRVQHICYMKEMQVKPVKKRVDVKVREERDPRFIPELQEVLDRQEGLVRAPRRARPIDPFDWAPAANVIAPEPDDAHIIEDRIFEREDDDDGNF